MSAMIARVRLGDCMATVGVLSIVGQAVRAESGLVTELQSPFLSALAMTIAFCAVPGAVTPRRCGEVCCGAIDRCSPSNLGRWPAAQCGVALSLAGAAVIAELLSVRLCSRWPERC